MREMDLSNEMMSLRGEWKENAAATPNELGQQKEEE
jgi:hypothetical protein